ncbi:MAG: Mor transcription activator family protein [Paraclostridium sp.]
MIEKLTIKDIPDSHKYIAHYVGIYAFTKLVKLMGGSSLYIPKEESLTRPIRNRIIKESFNGDYKSLAKKYNITPAQIRNIIDN